MSGLERQGQRAPRWAPDLGAARLVDGGRTVAMLRPDATVDWWCAPAFDDPPLCWQLLDPGGVVATFPDLSFVEADSAPVGSSTRTVLRAPAGLVQVWDALLDAGSGVALVRLLRPHRSGRGQPASPQTVEHVLRLVLQG